MPDFPGLAHVALTVQNVEVSGPWYRQLLDLDPVLDEHTDAGYRHLVWVLDGGTLTTSQPSTVLDCTGRRPRVIRPGAISADALRASVPNLIGDA